MKRYLAGHQAAARRQLELLHEEGPMAPADAFAAALELLELVDGTTPDPSRERQAAEVRALWTRIKQPWAARRSYASDAASPRRSRRSGAWRAASTVARR